MKKFKDYLKEKGLGHKKDHPHKILEPGTVEKDLHVKPGTVDKELLSKVKQKKDNLTN